MLADAQHGDFDWLWVLHPVDSVAPTNLTVQGADAYARPGINTFSGYVNDPSGVRSITLDIDGRTVECPVAAAFDSAWTCAVELGALTDATNVRIRARATDMSGNQSAFTAVQTLPVDLAPPTVALGAEIGQFLTDGLIGPAEMNWQGTVEDNRVAACPRYLYRSNRHDTVQHHSGRSRRYRTGDLEHLAQYVAGWRWRHHDRGVVW